MRRASWLPILFLCLAAAAAHGREDGGAADPRDRGGWFSRLIDRHLRSRPRGGEQLAGRALRAVDAYREWAGRPIEVVLVSQVASFDQDWRSTRGASLRVLAGMTGGLQTYTRDGTIRRFLLFRRGQALDPVALAESERLLRAQPFLSEVRISVVPLEGSSGSVAVVVETRDRWPIGLDARVETRDRLAVEMYSVNVLGWGTGLRHGLVHNGLGEPEWGYQGRLLHPNLDGSYLDLGLGYEDSWRRLSRSVGIERRLVHPGIRMVGGGSVTGLDDRDNRGLPRKFCELEAWIGRAHRLGKPDPASGSQALLVPAVGLSCRDFSARPAVSMLENRSYHDRRQFLAGLAYQRLKTYRTSFLYGLGDEEDIRSGVTLKATAAYEDGEFLKRTGGWLEAGLVSVRNRGDLAMVRAGAGGFLRDGASEQGVLNVTAAYITPLLGDGPFRRRWLAAVRFTRGFDRFPDETLFLDDRTGVREIPPEGLAGQRRLVLNLENRLFTPWSPLGFRCMMMGFSDLGWIDERTTGGSGFLASAGIGIRLANPDLVFPPLAVKVGLRHRAGGDGLIVVVGMGDASPFRPPTMPAVRPGPLPYGP